MKSLYRSARVVICLLAVIIPFYLYLPKRENLINRMNTTVGHDHVDVLLIGASHIGRGINPIQLYRDYGYASYTIWVGSQSPWQSYYYLKEACKTQSPSLVVIDAYKANVTGEEWYKDSETVNNLLDTPMSVNKISALVESNADSRLDILLRYPYIHDEYGQLSGLSVNKFYGNCDYSMGYLYDDSIETEAKDIIDKSRVTEVQPITEKNEKYLRAIIEYCINRDISIILVNAPCPRTNEDGQAASNYIRKITKEYNIPYIDGNLYWDRIGMDWSTDRADAHGHLNHLGITKFTSYVGGYINDNYTLPDRREDNEYSVYNEGVKWLEEELAGN